MSISRVVDGPPKGRSGCIVALYALFGVGVVTVLLGATVVYFFLESEEGQKALKVVREGFSWITTGANAPGTAELREAGCEVAIVHSAGSAIEVFLTLATSEQEREEMRKEITAEFLGDLGATNLEDLLLVLCMAPRSAVDPPSCTDVAAVYGQAVLTAPDEFAVVVAQQGHDGPHCQGLFTATGSDLF